MKTIRDIIESHLPNAAQAFHPAFERLTAYLGKFKLGDYGINPEGLQIKRKGQLVEAHQFNELTFQDFFENAYSAEGQMADAYVDKKANHDKKKKQEEQEAPDKLAENAPQPSAVQFGFERNIPCHEAASRWADTNAAYAAEKVVITKKDSPALIEEKRKKRQLIILLTLYQFRTEMVSAVGFLQRFASTFDEKEFLPKLGELNLSNGEATVSVMLEQARSFEAFAKQQGNAELKVLASLFVKAAKGLHTHFNRQVKPRVQALLNNKGKPMTFWARHKVKIAIGAGLVIGAPAAAVVGVGTFILAAPVMGTGAAVAIGAGLVIVTAGLAAGCAYVAARLRYQGPKQNAPAASKPVPSDVNDKLVNLKAKFAAKREESQAQEAYKVESSRNPYRPLTAISFYFRRGRKKERAIPQEKSDTSIRPALAKPVAVSSSAP